MTHIAIQEALEGTAVEWLEHVSDEQYQAGTQQYGTYGTYLDEKGSTHGRLVK